MLLAVLLLIEVVVVVLVRKYIELTRVEALATTTLWSALASISYGMMWVMSGQTTDIDIRAILVFGIINLAATATARFVIFVHQSPVRR